MIASKTTDLNAAVSPANPFEYPCYRLPRSIVQSIPNHCINCQEISFIWRWWTTDHWPTAHPNPSLLLPPSVPPNVVQPIIRRGGIRHSLLALTLFQIQTACQWKAFRRHRAKLIWYGWYNMMMVQHNVISDLYDIHRQSTRLPDLCPQVIQGDEYTSIVIKYLHHTIECYLISQLKDEAIGRCKTQQSTPPKHQNNCLFELIII
jgi:hypothetical protein